jgi:hypothetical protein
MPQYRLAASERAEKLAAVATVRSADSADANQNADDYLLALVLFASSLFFAGIATKVKSLGQREGAARRRLGDLHRQRGLDRHSSGHVLALAKAKAFRGRSRSPDPAGTPV